MVPSTRVSEKWVRSRVEAAKAAEIAPQKGKEAYELGKERSRLEKRLKKVEEQIEEMEALIEEKKEELLKPEYASSYSKLGEIQGEIDEKETELMDLMEEWESLGQQLEEL